MNDETDDDEFAGLVVRLTELDAPDSDIDPPVSSGPTCEECGTEIPWSGRGRRPRRCIDHKTRTAPKSSRRSSTRSTAKLNELTTAIEQGVAKLGGALAVPLPVTGVFTCGQATKVAPALARIAQAHPRILGAITTGVAAMDYAALAEFLAGFVMALSVDAGRMQPDALPARMIGITSIAEEIGLLKDTPQERPAERPSVFDVPAPPRFSVIS